MTRHRLPPALSFESALSHRQERDQQLKKLKDGFTLGRTLLLKELLMHCKS